MTTKEPLSTASSFLFTAAGLFIAYKGFEYSQALIIALIFLGTGSAAFHFGNSENNTPAHRLDEGGIYGVCVALSFHAWQSFPLVLIIGVIALSFGVLALRKLDLMVILPVFMVIIAFGIGINTGLFEAIITGGIAIIALSIRTVIPQSDPVHSLWHALLALDVALSWFYIHIV